MTQLLGANNSSAKIIASLIDRVAHTLWLVLSIPDRPPTPLPTHPSNHPPTHPSTHPPTATSPFLARLPYYLPSISTSLSPPPPCPYSQALAAVSACKRQHGNILGTPVPYNAPSCVKPRGISLKLAERKPTGRTPQVAFWQRALVFGERKTRVKMGGYSPRLVYLLG